MCVCVCVPPVVQMDDWILEEALLLPASALMPPAVHRHKLHLHTGSTSSQTGSGRLAVAGCGLKASPAGRAEAPPAGCAVVQRCSEHTRGRSRTPASRPLPPADDPLPLTDPGTDPPAEPQPGRSATEHEETPPRSSLD